MKVKFANKIYEVLYSKEVAGKTIYAVEDEPNHVDWLVNVEVIDTEEEPEDEKVRKEIIKLVKFYYGQTLALKHTVSRDKMLAWLEKQEDQKINDIGFKAKDCYVSKVDGKIHIASKLGPKFRDGDWIIFNGLTLYIKEIVQGYYRTISKGGIINSYDWGIDNAARFWTINEARDGDVLRLGDVIAIFKKYIGQEKCICYCSFCDNCYCSSCDNVGFEIPIENGEDNVYGCTNTTPATQRERVLLFQKMKEAGYTWDSDKKELVKL